LQSRHTQCRRQFWKRRRGTERGVRPPAVPYLTLR
jgi:hypothetical protein